MDHLPAHSIRFSSTHSIRMHPFHFNSSLPRSPRHMLNKHAKQSQGMKCIRTTIHFSNTNSSLVLPSPHVSSHAHPNHSAPKKEDHITIYSQRSHSHQSHYHPPNAYPSKTQSSFNPLPSSYLRCALLVVMTRACHVSCSSTITHSMPPNARSIEVEAPSHHFNRNSVPPRHV